MESIFIQITKRYGESVFPLYKEKPPFAEFKGGKGFLGVLLYDSNEDKVQCHLCGKWFLSLGAHINGIHKISSLDYKESVGLNRHTPLNSIGTRKLQQKRAIEQYPRKKDKLESGHKDYFKVNEHLGSKGRKRRLQYANSFATCDLQLKDRFLKLKEKLIQILFSFSYC